MFTVKQLYNTKADPESNAGMRCAHAGTLDDARVRPTEREPELAYREAELRVPQPNADGQPSGAPSAGEEPRERRSLADRVLELLAELDLAHDAEDEAYAMPVIGGARQVLAIQSKPFRDYVQLQCYVSFNKSLSGEALKQVVDTLAARARFAAPKRRVFRRVAGLEREIWLDLGDAAWRAAHVTADGWRIVTRPEPLIARTRDCQPLPEPARGRPGALDRAFDLFRLSPRERTLVRAWLLAAIRGREPFPVLAIVGEFGSGKSTFARFLLSLIDPAQAGLRSPPREERNLVAAARNSYVVAFENISSVNGDLSDGICRLATGAGIGGRALYSNFDDAVFYAARPVLLNGIPDLPERGDLLDRALIVTLEAVPKRERLLEAEVVAELEALRPAALAELLDATSRGFARWPALTAALRTNRRPLPRMADAALWAEACGVEEAVETMLAARWEGLAELAEADPVAAAIRELITASGGAWEGSVSELLAALDARREGARPPVGWPTSAHAMGNRVRRLAPALRAVRIEIEHKRRSADKARTISFRSESKGIGSATSATRPAEARKTVVNQKVSSGALAEPEVPPSATEHHRSATEAPPARSPRENGPDDGDKARTISFRSESKGIGSATSATRPAEARKTVVNQKVSSGTLAEPKLPPSATKAPPSATEAPPARGAEPDVGPGGGASADASGTSGASVALCDDRKCHQPSPCHASEKAGSDGLGGTCGTSFTRILGPGSPEADLASLAHALAAGALDRARRLFPEVLGREPVGRELWDLATLPSREAILAELDARLAERGQP